MRADQARNEALTRLLQTPLGAVEREGGGGPAAARARELFAGVRRHLITIDAVLDRYVPDAVSRIEPRLLEALRIGAFQLLYEGLVPRPLVVASTVMLAGPSSRKRGFLNAVLRRFASEIVTEEPESVLVRARDRVITGHRSVARFPEPVLPDFESDLIGYLSAQFGQVHWFVEALLRDLGDEIDALLLALMLPLPVAVRVNRLRAEPEAVEEALRSSGATILRRFGDTLEIRVQGAITECPPFQEGSITVQDVVASEVAPFVDPKPGERILDLCAGTGGKATHLAELSGGKAEIVAADVNGLQLARLEENLARLGTPGVRPLLLREGALASLDPFDRVLVDVPCSNSGVLMKRVAARYRLNPESVHALARMQLELLETGATRVRPGGVLVYSTCSILPQENGAVVTRFLERHPADFVLDSSRLSYPHKTGRDGGFMAKLSRRPSQ